METLEIKIFISLLLLMAFWNIVEQALLLSIHPPTLLHVCPSYSCSLFSREFWFFFSVTATACVNFLYLSCKIDLKNWVEDWRPRNTLHNTQNDLQYKVTYFDSKNTNYSILIFILLVTYLPNLPHEYINKHYFQNILILKYFGNIFFLRYN